MKGERVDATGKFLGKRGIHHPVPLDAAFPFERGGDYAYPEMRFAARQRAGMAVVKMRLIRDSEALRMKGLGELFCEARPDGHDSATFLPQNLEP
jgi:hypothetical protein